MEHKDPDLIFRELRSPPVQLLREREKQVEQKKKKSKNKAHNYLEK
jgi:hypothetical protein